jgi:hypothetical protein
MTGTFPFEGNGISENTTDFVMDRCAEDVATMLSTIDDWTWFSNPIPVDDLSSELHILAKDHLAKMPDFSGKENIGIEIRTCKVQDFSTVGSIEYLDALMHETYTAIVNQYTPDYDDTKYWVAAANAFYRVFHIVSTIGHKFYEIEEGKGRTIVNSLARPKIDHIARIFASHAAHLITFDCNSPWEPLIDIWAMGYYPDRVDTTTGNYVILNLSEGFDSENLVG